MVDEIRQELVRLNQLLVGVTPYRLGVATPEEFTAAPVNAHFMAKRVYDQLVANIQQDGNLSSLPFCWHDAGGEIHMMSGHHRVEAARDAGVTAVLYLYTDAELTSDERTAIQLSHNALVGEDDLAILRRQWESIASIEAKLYSGLDDELFKTFDPVHLGAFNERDIRFDTIELLFLPGEIERLTEILQKLGKSKRVRFAALQDQYDAFTDALMRLKESTTIFNSATAFMVMAEVAGLYCDWVDQVGTWDAATWLALHETLAVRGLVDAIAKKELSR